MPIQRTLTLLTLLFACIAAASVSYYFGRYLPRLHDAELAEQARKSDLANARRCDADGRKFYSELRKSVPESSPDEWYDPEIHYSGRLNTCLVEGGWQLWDGTGMTVSRDVTDIYSNRTVTSIDYYVDNGGRETLLSVPDKKTGMIDSSRRYFAEKDDLFSQ